MPAPIGVGTNEPLNVKVRRLSKTTGPAIDAILRLSAESRLAVCMQWKWGPRPPRALPTGALAAWHQSAASHQPVNPIRRLKKWLARAPATAPAAGALPFS